MKPKEIESKIKGFHHRLELIRTVVPCIILVIQLFMLAHMIMKG